MIPEGADFLRVSSVELRMSGHSSINDTVCTNVMIVNDTDIEDQEQFSVILETLDPAVIINLKLGTIIIPVDSHDSKWHLFVYHLIYFRPSVAIFGITDPLVTLTEGVNATFPLCIFLESLSGNFTRPISVSLVTHDIGTAKGTLHYL